MTAQRRNWQTMIGPLPTGPDPFAGKALDLLVWIYRHPDLPATMRIEAARAAISFETPKLSAAQNINIAASLRELVYESMQRPAPGDPKAIEHQPQPPASAVIDAQPEPVPVQPVAEPDPDGAVGPAQPVPRPSDGGKECTGTGPPQPFGAPAVAGEGFALSPARGPLPGPDRAMDSAQRFEELRREREREREAEALRASQPTVGTGLVRPYEAVRYSPKSEAALDVEFHVRRIRRAAGLPD